MNERWLNETRTRLGEVLAEIARTEEPIQLDLRVEQDDGGVLAVLINVSVLLLCYHGIPMDEMCVAVAAGAVLDPCMREQKNFCLRVVFGTREGRVLYMRGEGRCRRGEVAGCLRRAADGYRQMREIITRELVN